MRFGTWNAWSLHRSGSVTTVVREIVNSKLDLGVQEVRCDKGDTTREGDYTFFNGKDNENHPLGTEYFYTRIEPAVKTVELISDKMSYIVLRGRWCNIIAQNAHAPAEEKNDDMFPPRNIHK